MQVTAPASTALGALERVLVAVEARDLQAALALIAPEAVFEDPNYLEPRMVGPDAIAGGLRWAFSSLESLGFQTVRAFEADGGLAVALEVATDHALPGGARLAFPQAFFAEARDGRLTRLRAYGPNGPGGVAGLALGAARLLRRLDVGTRARSRR